MRKIYPFHLVADRVALCEAVNGNVYAFDPLDLSIGLHLILRGEHEPWMEAVLLRVLRPGDFVIEVGANIGYHTVTIAKIIGSSGTLIACEPNRKTVTYLERNLVMNGVSARVAAVAIGDKEGVSSLFVLKDDCGGCSVDRLLPCNELKREATYAVPMTTVDILSAGRPVGLLRIDAEGSEAAILAGAKGTSCRNIIMEHNPDYYTQEFEDAVGALRETYDIYALRSERLYANVVGPIRDLEPCDLLCVRK